MHFGGRKYSLEIAPTIANEYYFQTLKMLLIIILKVVSKE